MIYIAYILVTFAIVSFLVATWNFWFLRRNQLVAGTEKALVSILVPIRNEELNLVGLIESLSTQTYTNFELILYDDESTDRSWEIVSALSQSDSRIKLIKGSTLPEGWLGKNNACHQMSLVAKGKYFLFVDADVRFNPTALGGLVGYLLKSKSQVLSVFPYQTILSKGEKSTVPLMMHILLSLLPLYWVRNSAFSSMAAANGQLLLFEADLYKALQPHKTFKKEKVEDILTARYIKKHKYKLSCLAGNKEITCRMYQDYKSAMNGFTKFLPEFFGGSTIIAFIYWVNTSFAWLIVGFSLNSLLGLFVLFLQLSTRFVASKAANLNPWDELKFLPAQQFNFIYILLISVYKTLNGNHVWKDRKIG